MFANNNLCQIRLLSEASDLISASLRFHDLRHTHATGLIGAGSSIKVVSRRLGHSDISITLRVYAHLLPDDDEKLANQSEAAVG